MFGLHMVNLIGISSTGGVINQYCWLRIFFFFFFFFFAGEREWVNLCLTKL